MKNFSSRKKTEVRQGNRSQLFYQKILFEKKHTTSSHICDICGAVFVLPISYADLITTAINDWCLDVGGICTNPFCLQSLKYLCPKHAKFVLVSENVWLPGCQSCGEILHPGSAEAFEMISDYLILRISNTHQLRR